MKKFGFIVLVLLILGIVIMVAMVSSGDYHVRPTVTPAVNDSLKEEVIGVVLADPRVQGFLNSSYERAEPGYIKPGETGAYVKNNDRYAGVSFSSNAGGEPIYLTVIVDTQTMNETAIRYTGLPGIMDSWIIVPPGNAIASEMGRGFFYTTGMKYFVPGIDGPDMEIHPEGAELYPIIVNEDNYRKYLNGSAYDVPELIDHATNGRVRINGSQPITSGWSVSFILPPEIQSYRVDDGISTRYYLILENREADREIKVIYRHPLGAMYK